MIPEGFDWQTDDSVVVPYQPALAVYVNTRGSIVIRQERGELEDEDTIVIITPANAQTVADGILRTAREIEAGANPQRQIADQRALSKSNGRQTDAFTNGLATA